MTEKADLKNCDRCGREFPSEDLIEDGGVQICENCYINAHQKIKACDPWAVRSKKILREKAGALHPEIDALLAGYSESPIRARPIKP